LWANTELCPWIIPGLRVRGLWVQAWETKDPFAGKHLFQA
jgi:hypothetical protein